MDPPLGPFFLVIRYFSGVDSEFCIVVKRVIPEEWQMPAEF